MYDLNLIPIHLRQRESFELQSGFHAAVPPRRATRSRTEDMLVLSLFINGGESVPADVLQNWLERLTQDFYKTSGSVTAALRTLVETLNLIMLEKNLKAAGKGSSLTGALTLAAIHRQSLYLAQSGPAHAYVLTRQGLDHFYDSSQSDHGLGMSRTPAIRYYQVILGEDGYLFMTDGPPETWTEELLTIGSFPDLAQLQRRLLNQAPADFRLDLVHMTPGEGQVHVQESAKPTPGEKPSIESIEEVTPVEEARTSVDEPQTETREVGFEDTQKIKSQIPVTKAPSPEPDQVQPDVQRSRMKQPESNRVPSLPVSERVHQQRGQLKEKGLKGLAAFFDWHQDVKKRMDTFFSKLLGKIPAGDKIAETKLSGKTLLIIALLVPIVLVAVAAGIYSVRGRTMQYDSYYGQALTHSHQGLTAEDPDDSHHEWQQVLTLLDQAESYRITDDSAALRVQAQEALDLLDGAVRLSYHPAITSVFTSDIHITQIISFGTDLYLFDETGGRVIHAERASQGYEIDPDFVCAAGNFDGGSVGTLVDMTALPINNTYQAHVLAADGAGNVVYCAPEQTPIVQALPISAGATVVVKRITYASGYLYVLDPAANTVRVYQATDDQYLDATTDFFEGIESGGKPDISHIVDMSVSGQELFLLREDGLLVDCVSSGLSSEPVICENPVTYLDSREGREEQTVTMPESSYVSVLYTEPPDPTISILDAVNADIYQFSVRFKLYQRLRPDLGDYDIDSTTATAFTIGIDRIVFLAFGNQVFYAYLD